MTVKVNLFTFFFFFLALYPQDPALANNAFLARQMKDFLALKGDIKKVEKKLDHQSSSFIFNRNTGRLRTYKITQNLVAENCSLGIDQKIIALRSKKTLEHVLGPIFVEKWLDIYTKDLKQNNNYGWSIKFNGENPYLLFNTKEKREKALIQLFKLKRLCTRKNRLRRELLVRGADPLKMGELGFGHSNKTRTFYLNPKLNWEKKSLSDIKKLLTKDLEVPREDTFGDSALFGTQFDSPVEMALLGGEKSFVERYRTILQAKKSIHITNLHMPADETGLTLGHALMRKRLQGLDISLYLDAFIPFVDIRDLKIRENSYRLYHNFMATGIPVYGYRCHSKFEQLKKEWKHGRAHKNETFFHRHHEKLWITDNREVIVGGANITNLYHRIEERGRNYWRDQDVLIRGEAFAREITQRAKQDMFEFNQDFGDPRQESCFNRFEVGSKEFYQFLKKHYKAYKKPKNIEKFKKDHAHALKKIENLKKGLIDGESFRPIFHMIEEARAIFSYPKKKQTHLEKAYIELIENSKFEILITNSYLIFSPQMVDALKRAANRGVKIKLLTNGPETNDPPTTMTPLARSLYKTLVEDKYGTPSEIEIYEWNGRENGDQNGAINFGMIHAKYAIFDQKISLVGSYNFDSLSRNFNAEMAIIYKEKEITQELVKEFYDVDLTFSRKVNYQEMLTYHRPRGTGQKILLKILKRFKTFL